MDVNLVFLGCRRRFEKETTAAEISIRAIINMQIGDCPLFFISGGTGMNQHSQSEGVA